MDTHALRRSLAPFAVSAAVVIGSCCGFEASSQSLAQVKSAGTTHTLPPAETLRISASMGGVAVSPSDNSFVVMLVTRQGDMVPILCGGVAITNRFVLTAAHCVRSLGLPATLVVQAAAPRVLTFESYCHPRYSRDGDVVHDLALLEVTEGALTPFAGPRVAVPARSPDLRFVVLGFGQPMPGILARSPLMPFGDDRACEDPRDYPGQELQPDEICVGSATTSAPCQLDSGGPLFTATQTGSVVTLRQLVGVVSQADDCGAGTPGIHAGFDADTLSWIQNVIGQNNAAVRAESAAACRQ
jgi:secreted trypsin-like serine protease